MPLILSASVSGPLKAYGTGHWDYFFTNEGIVRRKMLSGLAYTTIAVILAAVSIFTCMILIAITARALSDRSRRKLSIFTLGQLTKSFKPIPWSSVSSFNLKGRNLTLRIDRTKYKMIKCSVAILV